MLCKRARANPSSSTVAIKNIIILKALSNLSFYQCTQAYLSVAVLIIFHQETTVRLEIRYSYTVITKLAKDRLVPSLARVFV